VFIGARFYHPNGRGSSLQVRLASAAVCRCGCCDHLDVARGFAGWGSVRLRSARRCHVESARMSPLRWLFGGLRALAAEGEYLEVLLVELLG